MCNMHSSVYACSPPTPLSSSSLPLPPFPRTSHLSLSLSLPPPSSLPSLSLSHTHLPHVVFRSGVGSPVVGEVVGEYKFDSKKHVLEWRLPVIDASNTNGSMEFTIAGMESDFFPIRVEFISTKTYSQIEVGVACSSCVITNGVHSFSQTQC